MIPVMSPYCRLGSQEGSSMTGEEAMANGVDRSDPLRRRMDDIALLDRLTCAHRT
jgi:hypothetical protein